MRQTMKKVEDWLKGQPSDTSFSMGYDKRSSSFVVIVDQGRFGKITRVGNDLDIIIDNAIQAAVRNPRPEKTEAKPVLVLPGLA